MTDQMEKRIKIAMLMVAIQAVMTLSVTLVALGLYDSHIAWSTAVGGVVSIFSTAFFSLRLFYGKLELVAERFLARFYAAEMQKIVLTVVLLIIVIKYLNVAVLAVFVGFIASMLAQWIVLLFKF